MVKAYKGFHSDLTCTMGKGIFQYRENEWMEEQEANCARNGFHCCYNPLDCLSYYGNFKESAYYLVCAAGDIHEDGNDTKISCTKIKLVKRLLMEEFVAHSLMYMREHPYLEMNHNVNWDSVARKPDNGMACCILPMGRGWMETWMVRRRQEKNRLIAWLGWCHVLLWKSREEESPGMKD